MDNISNISHSGQKESHTPDFYKLLAKKAEGQEPLTKSEQQILDRKRRLDQRNERKDITSKKQRPISEGPQGNTFNAQAVDTQLEEISINETINKESVQFRRSILDNNIKKSNKILNPLREAQKGLISKLKENEVTIQQLQSDINESCREIDSAIQEKIRTGIQKTLSLLDEIKDEYEKATNRKAINDQLDTLEVEYNKLKVSNTSNTYNDCNKILEEVTNIKEAGYKKRIEAYINYINLQAVIIDDITSAKADPVQFYYLPDEEATSGSDMD